LNYPDQLTAKKREELSLASLHTSGVVINEESFNRLDRQIKIMKTASQPTLPASPEFVHPSVRDWREPQMVTASGLAGIITEAGSEGFDTVRMEMCTNPFGYRLTFQRKTNTELVRASVREKGRKTGQTHGQSTC
jgi:hypothetical protein